MHGTPSLLQRIATHHPSLSRAERRVADWVLTSPRRSAELTVSELASASGVSEPTVIRFCRSLGLSGYRELKERLLVTLHHPDNYLHQDIGAADTPGDVMNKVIDSTIRSLLDLREQASAMPTAEATQRLAKSRQIIFLGVGASGVVAQDARQKFFRLGIPCSVALDAQTILQCSAIANATDTFIAISNTGTLPEMIEAMATARLRGASVIAVTDARTPLTEVADLVFPCQPLEDTSLFTPMSSRVNHLALLDALQVALALQLGQRAERNLRLSKDALRRQWATG